MERNVIEAIARAQDTLSAYKAGRWEAMRKAREAQEGVWEIAWDALLVARMEEKEAATAARRRTLELSLIHI